MRRPCVRVCISQHKIEFIEPVPRKTDVPLYVVFDNIKYLFFSLLFTLYTPSVTGEFTDRSPIYVLCVVLLVGGQNELYEGHTRKNPEPQE